jgi:hypothetical protein
MCSDHMLPSLTRDDTASGSSPEFQTYGDFIASPFDDSPLDDFLMTPDILQNDADFLQSPLISPDMAPFGDGGVDVTERASTVMSTGQKAGPAKRKLDEEAEKNDGEEFHVAKRSKKMLFVSHEPWD